MGGKVTGTGSSYFQLSNKLLLSSFGYKSIQAPHIECCNSLFVFSILIISPQFFSVKAEPGTPKVKVKSENKPRKEFTNVKELLSDSKPQLLFLQVCIPTYYVFGILLNFVSFPLFFTLTYIFKGRYFQNCFWNFINNSHLQMMTFELLCIFSFLFLGWFYSPV